MTPLYVLDRGKASVLQPQTFPLKESINNIFAVSVDNALGTNDLDNAITLIKFDKDRMQYEVRSKDFLKYVGGGDLTFLPVFSADTIGYAQTRRFILFNIKENSFQQYMISGDFDDTIMNVAVIDAERKYFLFEIRHIVSYDSIEKILKIVELGTVTDRLVSSLKIGETDIWAVIDKKIFVFRGNRLEVFDSNFQPMKHPLVSLFNEKAKKMAWDLIQLYLHPYLPFAVFVENGRKVSVATWNNNHKEPQLFRLFENTASRSYTFSPNGEWLIFVDVVPRPPRYFLMPVNPELPYYLGRPIMLGKAPFVFSTAWIANPLSFIVSEGNRLLKWTLSEKGEKAGGSP